MSRLTLLAAALLLCPWLPAASLRYWIEPCSDPQMGCRAGDPELAQWALEAWESAAEGGIALTKTDDRLHAQIRVYWAGGPGGLFGETKPIVVDGMRGAEVFVVADVAASTKIDALLRDTIVYLTCLHETGHALGLNHTAEFADIMYNFQYGGDIGEYFGRYRRQISKRADIRKHSGIARGDLRQLVELGLAPARPARRH